MASEGGRLLRRSSSIILGRKLPEQVEKALKKLGCRVQNQDGKEGEYVDYEFSDGPGSSAAVLSAVMCSIVEEACGKPKGVIKRPEGDVVVDTAAAPPTVAFADVVKGVDFPFDDLPVDDNVGLICEMTYNRCLSATHGDDAVLVTQYPRCLRGAASERADYALAGSALLSMKRGSSTSKLRVQIRLIETMMSRMCSTDFVANRLPPEWKNLLQQPIANISGLLDDAQLAIAEFWNESKQTDRDRAYTTFLMNAVGSDLCNYFATQIPNGAFRCPKKMTEAALSICEDWISTCSRLTTLDWGSSWATTPQQQQQPYSDATLARLRKRLRVVVAMRSLHQEVTGLLSASDMRALRGDNLYEVFDSVKVFDVSVASEQKWETTVTTFYRRLEPLEHRCSAALRDLFGQRSNATPQAILAEFAQYKELMKRPIIAKELVSERDTLLAKLSERVQSIRLELEHRSQNVETKSMIEEDRKCQAGRHMPAVINKVIWVRQLRFRVEQLLTTSNTLLSDLPRTEEFTTNGTALLHELEEYEQETFKNWTFDRQDSGKSLTLNAMSKVLDMDADGKVEVNYSEQLVTLLREVRIFNALGFNVPSNIQQMAVQAMKFYQSGLALKQVASIYNTMTQDIIPSTKAVLLESALAFENVISGGTGQKQLTWGNTAETELFITKLRSASGLLTDNNRHLHRMHTEIGEIVLELFKIDLLRSRDRWMGRVRAIREILHRSGFAHMEAWMRHWDFQLYKALEYQYQLGLESLHEVVSEIRADVVYDAKSAKAVLRPPLEVLRESFYQKIKDFLTFPNRFTGVGNNDFFARMPAHNERGIFAVMQHTAALFRRIEKEVRRFQPMVIVGRCGRDGTPALEDIVGAALTEVQHWEANIRLLKQKGKEIGSVDVFVKISCVTLSTAGIKSAVEEQLSKLADVLNVTLRKSAQGHLTKIDKWLDDATLALATQYTTLEDVNKGNLVYAQLMEQRQAVEVEFHHFGAKNKLLQSVTNTTGIAFKPTKQRWDDTMKRLDNIEKEMEAQLESLKNNVTSATAEYFRELEKFTAQWDELKPKEPKTTTNADKAVTFIEERLTKFAALKKQGADLRAQAAYFHLDDLDLTRLEDLESDIVTTQKSWSVYARFQGELKTLQDEKWITFRSKIYRFEDFTKQWQDNLKDPAQQTSNAISLHVRTLLDEWTRLAPTLKFVRGDGMTPTHWNELFRIVGIQGATVDTLEFRQLLDRAEAIVRSEKQLKTLHARAQAEAQIREALDDVRTWASTTQFKLIPHPDRKNVVLITEWKEIMTNVNDNQSLLFSMKESPYFAPFAEDASKWEARFAMLDDYLHLMNSIQRKWVYLEPIFARGALPHEQPRFERVDRDYLLVMKEVQRDPKVISLTNHAEYKEKLRAVLDQLERCQKALNEFLEQKRDRFPRFYFISDDDLLEILGQSRNVHVIQSHLKKLFMGIHSVRFDKEEKHIVEILSLEGECVSLAYKVEIKVDVEDWLNDLDKAMKNTLQKNLVSCLQKLSAQDYASQILCLCEQITFTKKAEEAFKDKSGKGGLKTLKANLQTQLRDLTTFCADNSDVVMDLKLKGLVMDLIHNIDVADMLLRNNVDKETDWLWSKQLRFYLDRDGLSSIRMVDAHFRYTYEYQGNAPKLVHTPLTDKCYLTLTQGMHLGYGGNPYGPAGTGKTESVKALGNAMGRQVLVFNCDEGIDFKSMGRIFTGLVMCGAWGCFDEFNRLKVDQLSAVSQMIQVIQEALKNGEKDCQLLGRTISVNPDAGIFVTLNPAGKGYGGRSVLPDNLKQLFRGVAMSVPDNELITETILLSEGFENGSELARNIVEIFRLSKQLLSPQQHYDWGLRALKAVLRLGGVLVHQFLKEKKQSGVQKTPEEILAVESEIVIKSLRVNTLSKLTFDDVKLFNGLIHDVFPSVAIREITYPELMPAILEAIKELKLQVLDSQIAKILQLYEALNQRMGVVLVGPSGSGKSTLLRILRRAMIRLGTNVPQHVMNPKAMPRQQLLGHMDLDTREWFDGVLTEAAKRVVREDTKVRSWIFCDGDIDPEWVESLNSVLDDNKLLTMPNGVRIQFGSNVNFIFETHSLQYASPATVSRCGMIFLSEQDVDPRSAVASWLAEQPAEVQGQLGTWISEYFFKAVDTLIGTKAVIVDTTYMGLVMSGLSQLAGVRSKAHFAHAMVAGLGSYLTEVNRVDFAKDVYHMIGERLADPKNPINTYYNVESGMLRAFQHEPAVDMTVADLRGFPMVQTVDVQRNLNAMEAWVRQTSFRPFILVGPEGCGKTMLLRNCFEKLTNVRVAVVNCSAQTVAIHVIQKLRQMCQVFNTNQGRVLRPKDADRLILLLRDLNLPKPDKYGTVQLHSFLQQLILYQGFYDNDLEWVTVERLQIVGSMNPPGSTGRFPVAPRFIAIVSVLSLSYPTKESIQSIYSDFFNVLLPLPQFQQVSFGSKGAADLARVLTTVYDAVATKYTVDEASHYIFNPRDLTRWVLNVLNYNLENASFLEVLVYEAERIFADRIVKADDRKKVTKLIGDAFASMGLQRDEKTERCFSSWLDAAGGGSSGAAAAAASAGSKTSAGGGNGKATTTGSGSSNKRLSQTKVDDLKKAAEGALVLYSRERTELNIQLLPEVLIWMARVDRVLSSERGNCLLVGRSGVCGKEIVKLAAHQLKMEVFTLHMGREYSVKAFSAEVKAAIGLAGVQATHCVLLLEDFNFGNSTFLEMINSLLAAGEIPGIYGQDELDAILGPLKEEAVSEGFDGAYSYFVDRVTRFLHLAIVMDPTNTEYEARCRSNPALFTRCTVCWLGSWTSESMKLVPRLMLKDIFRALDSRDEREKKSFSLTNELFNIHTSLGEGRFSPQDYKALLETYRQIFRNKSTSADEDVARLQRGLNKLAEAEQNVADIQKEVGLKQVEMQAKQKEADEALVQIQAKMEEAGEQKRNIEKIKKEAAVEEGQVQKKKGVIEKQLSGIQPILDSAREAVGQIKSEHLAELKAFKNPPPAVQDVLEGVLMIFGKDETSWAAIRKFLTGDGVKSQILNFDTKSITEQTRNIVERHLNAKANSFKPEVIGRASAAAAPMAAWLKANIEYSKVLESVQPMNDELRGYQANLDKISEKLQKYEEKLKRLDTKVDELKTSFGKRTKEAERLKDRLEQAENTLSAAQNLLGKLVQEKTRWTEQVGSMQKELRLMPRKALLAAGFMTYLAQEPENVRAQIVNEWKNRIGVDDFNFFTFLRTESTMLQYKSEGLPADDLSMQNAVTILEQSRVAMIVDPASQAMEWLKTHLKRKDVPVEVCSVGDDRFVNTLELAIRFGKVLLLCEVSQIEPLIYPLLRRELTTEGPKKLVQIGDRAPIDYADSFQLFLLTRSTDLKLPPDISSFLTEVNFSITRSGLEGQLLGQTIQHEQPELEREKIEILKNEESLKMQLAKLEESLLRDLAQSTGSLLENTTLIESLNQIKTQATSIAESLQKSRELQVLLDEKRNVYRPFAATGSTVFFLLKDLRALSHMYQFSLAMFLKLFQATLTAMAGVRINIDEKMQSLCVDLERRVVAAVSRALFKGDRITFGVHLARALFPESCTSDEWNFFVNRSVAPEADGAIPSFVLQDSLKAFRRLRGAFPAMIEQLQLQKDSDVWYQWMRSAAPETDASTVMGKLTPFQQLLVIKTLRADRLIPAMNLWACRLLNVDSLTDGSTLANIVDTASEQDPILLITTPGADPSFELQTLAYERVGRARFHQVAMGGGQAEEAMSLLRRCSTNGEWLFLKNLHLVIPWVSVLEKELNLLKAHKDFRLWLTSEPHDEFPSILLSSALKVTFEAPPGIKQNMLRTYNFWSKEYYATKSPLQGQLLFSLGWLHAIVQERRTYIPQGWSKFYEFSLADLKSAADVISAQSKGDQIDWKSIHGILELAIYGGRLESEYDARVLRTYLSQFFRDEVLSTAPKRQAPLSRGLSLIPATGEHRLCSELAHKLPDSDVPAYFSLPPNADRVVQRTRVLKTVNDLQRLVENREVARMSKEEWAASLTPILQTWMQLCQPHADLLTHRLVGKRDPEPLKGFICGEMDASLTLVRTVEATMESIKAVIDGTALLSEKLKAESSAIIAGEVPFAWEGQFSGPEKIVPWLKALVDKTAAIRKWSALSNEAQLLRSRLNLSDLFRPQTFLNALRQETAHMTREPLVSLRLVSNVGSSAPGCALSVAVSGLLLQGATLDGEGVLQEIDSADAIGLFAIPDVYIGWAKPMTPDPSFLGVPVYTNSSKETFLMELMMKTHGASEIEKFILGGAALVLEE